MKFLSLKSLVDYAKQAAKNLWNGHWHSLHAPMEIGIYWSGKYGAGQGQLYLDGDAKNNPHYDSDAAAKIGRASMDTKNGYYEIGVLSVTTDCSGVQTSHTVDCSDAGKCIMDTGNPFLEVPQAVYDELVKGHWRGTLTVNLLASFSAFLPLSESQSVKLEFDVEILYNNGWISPSKEGNFALGLPVRAFYYTVMDLSDSMVSFSPMPAYHH